MINVASLVQLKAFARQYGVFVALLWTVSFLAVVLVPTSPWGNLLAVSTPVLAVKEIANIRELILNFSPVEKSFIFMMQNLFIGFVMSLPLALICRRSK